MSAMALAFTYFMGSAGSSDYTPTVLIIDNDASQYSQMFIDEIEGNNSFRYEITSYEDGESRVENSKVLASFVIDKGFGANIEKGKAPNIKIMKIKDDRDIFTLESILRNTSTKMLGNIKIAQIASEEISKSGSQSKEQLFNRAYKASVEGWKYRKPVEVIRETINVKNENGYDSTKHGIIGFTLFFSMFTIVFAVGEILMDRKNNTWQRLLISPISKGGILGGNFIVSFLIGFFQISVLVIGGQYLFKVDLGDSVGGLLLLAGAFTFSVTSLGLFLSGIVKTHAQLSAITPIVLTSTGMLGGTMWPLEIVNSKIVLALANITPQKWAVQGMERIAMHGEGFNAAIIPTLILLGMGMIYFTLGVRLVKYE